MTPLFTESDLAQLIGRSDLGMLLDELRKRASAIRSQYPTHRYTATTIDRAILAIEYLHARKEELRTDLRGCVCRVAPGQCKNCGYTPPSDAGDDEAQGALPFVTEAFCEVCDRECQTTLADERVLCTACAADPMNQPAYDGAELTLGEAIDRAEAANDAARDA